jgi:signal transduction histidine kinase
LRLKGRPGQAPNDNQIKLLNSLAPEIALALALSLATSRQLAQASTKAQINERRHLAYVMHNSLAQQIGFLLLSLGRLAGDERLGRPGQAEAVRAELAQMYEVADDAYNRVRNAVALLRTWGEMDLPQAIRNYAQAIARHTRLKIDVAVHGTPIPLLPQLNQQILSLVQEGLNNVEKHARARHTQITVRWSPENLRLDIADDGIGFAASAAPPPNHFGLTMMWEVVKSLGGEATVESALARGTRLSFNIPLTRGSADWEPEQQMPADLAAVP